MVKIEKKILFHLLNVLFKNIRHLTDQDLLHLNQFCKYLIDNNVEDENEAYYMAAKHIFAETDQINDLATGYECNVCKAIMFNRPKYCPECGTKDSVPSIFQKLHTGD